MVCALAYVAVHTFPPYGAHLYVPPPHMPLPGLCPCLLHEIWLIRPHICPMAFFLSCICAPSLVPCLMPTWVVTHCNQFNTSPLEFSLYMTPNMPSFPGSMPTWDWPRLCLLIFSHVLPWILIYVPPITAWANAHNTFDLLGPAILYLFLVLATSFTGIITLYVLDLYILSSLHYGLSSVGEW